MPTSPFLRSNRFLLNASCGFLLSGTLLLSAPDDALAELTANLNEAESKSAAFISKPKTAAASQTKTKFVDSVGKGKKVALAPKTTVLKSTTTLYGVTLATLTKPAGSLILGNPVEPTTKKATQPTVKRTMLLQHKELNALHSLEARTTESVKTTKATPVASGFAPKKVAVNSKVTSSTAKKPTVKTATLASTAVKSGATSSNGLKKTDAHRLGLAPYHTHLPMPDTSAEKTTTAKNAASNKMQTVPAIKKDKNGADKLAVSAPKLEKIKLEKLKPLKEEKDEIGINKKEKVQQEKERKKQQNAARKHPDQSALNNLPGVTVSNPGSDNQDNQTDKPMEMVSLVNGGVTASLKEINVKLDRPTLIGLVEKNNLDLRIADSRVGQAKGAYVGSYANFMPSIRGQLYVERYNGGTIIIQATPIDVKRVTYRPRLSFDYQLPLGGKPIFQVRAARFKLASQDYARDQTLQNALFDALAQYYQMVRNRMSRVITEQSLASMEMLVKVNEAKLKSGFGTRFEIEQAKVQLAERANQLLEARNDAAISSIALASTLNLPVESEFTPDVDALTPIRFIDPQLPMSHFLAKADAQRPDLKQLAAEIKVARAAYQASFSDLLPTFGITSYIGGVGPKTDQLRSIYQRGISLDIDLLKNMGVNTVGNLKTARARLAESIAEREKQVNEIHRQLATAYLDWQRYAQQIHVMKQKADAAEEAYRLSMARFKTGFGIQLEVLQAQTEYTNAIREIQTAILNYNTAQLKLLLTAGRLTPQNVLLGEEETNFFSHNPDLLKINKQALDTPAPTSNPAAKVPSPLDKEG